MSDSEHQVPIWFFIGVVLTIYGMLILGVGLYGCFHPPDKPLPLSNLHADVWWGGLLAVVGGFYVRKFRPGRPQ